MVVLEQGARRPADVVPSLDEGAVAKAAIVPHRPDQATEDTGAIGLRPAAQRYIAGVVGAALILLVPALGSAGWPTRGELVLAALLTGAATLAGLFPIHFAYKTKGYVSTAVTFAAILVLPVGLAMLVAGAGVLLAWVLRGDYRDPDEGCFNAGQSMLQSAAGGLLLALVGWEPTAPAFGTASALPALGLAGGSMYLVNLVAVPTVVALQEGVPVLRTWRQEATEDARTGVLTHLSLLATGAVAAMVATVQPWALGLLAVPVAATYVSLRHHVQLRQQAEAARQGSDASLAEAQRIAQLGSWEWDLATGHQRWSEETYRVFGHAPGSFSPTADVFFCRVHPDDRPHLTRATRRAVADGVPFSLEHRAVLADGRERMVHLRGELVRDADGQPRKLVGTVQDVTDRKELEALLAHRAFHDPLTDLPNRDLFSRRLEQALARSEGGRPSLAVLFLDLDGFKLVNDTLGHQAGDQLLVAAAGRLRACLGPSDTVARFGGDEFAVLLHEATRHSAAFVAECLVAALRPPFPLAGREACISASIGVATVGPCLGSADDLLRAADIALYRAKAAGRGAFAFYEPGMEGPLVARLGRESGLRRAIERGELRLAYQPVVELATGQIAGIEALVRWQHPTRGLLLPDAFVPLAEESGLIVALGRWVLAEACRQAAAWQDRAGGRPPVSVSVNLSARQFQGTNLVTEVRRALAEAGLEPSCLEVEMTESAAMGDLVATRRTLREFRDLRVRVAIDDFGIGHSSLGRLRELAPDALKIDRSLVAGLGDDAGSRAILRAATTLGHDLGMTVTAEGIETAEQAAQLQLLGVRLGQGFYFAPPLDAAAVSALLSSPIPVPWAHAGRDRIEGTATSVVAAG